MVAPRFLASFIESTRERVEDQASHRGRYTSTTPRAPGSLTPTSRSASNHKTAPEVPAKNHRRLHERFSSGHHGVSRTTPSKGGYARTSSAVLDTPERVQSRSTSMGKRTQPSPPPASHSRRLTSTVSTSTSHSTATHMSPSSRTKPRPPSGSMASTASSRNRWLGPMPEPPPPSVLQQRPQSAVPPNSARSSTAMRSRRYVPSINIPANSSMTPAPPSARQHPPSNLPVPPSRRATSVSATSRSATLFTPRDIRPRSARPHHQPSTTTSYIRHTSATPVRVTKDLQLSRERERQATRARHQATPQHPVPAYRHESPLTRRRATVTATPSTSVLNSARRSSQDTTIPAPPVVPAFPSGTQAVHRSESAFLTTPRPLTAVTAEFSTGTEAGMVTSAISVGINNTPRDRGGFPAGSKPGHLSHDHSGNLSHVQATCAPEAYLEGYEIGPVIGEGGFCKVKKGHHVASGQSIAIKVINKRALKDKHDWRRVGREIRILKRLKNHPAVIHVYDIVSLPSEVYVIQELAQGGSLLDYIRDRKRVSEQMAIRFFLQIVAGLQYCHAHEVVHRDIKLENLLMDPDKNMKIIDFGLAAIFTPGRSLKVHCGSPSYAAPEIIGRRSYDGPPVDVWSLGIVTYAMVCGHLPFYSRNGRSDLSRKIMAGKYATPDYMSDDMKDIVAGMLTLDPAQRLTLSQVSTHRWVTGSLASRNVSLARALLSVNEATGSYVFDNAILDHMELMGINRDCVIHDLNVLDCNQVTSMYFLLAEAKREGKRLPTITKATCELGRTLVGRSRAAQTMHGFPLDVENSGDRDDQAHFAPSRNRRPTSERCA